MKQYPIEHGWRGKRETEYHWPLPKPPFTQSAEATAAIDSGTVEVEILAVMQNEPGSEGILKALPMIDKAVERFESEGRKPTADFYRNWAAVLRKNLNKNNTGR